jgi:hypothetical protein
MTNREALDKLLRFKPGVMIQRIDSQHEIPDRDDGFFVVLGRKEGPWIEVDFEDGERFAIWKSTGLCYRLDKQGAVEEEPVEV